MSNIAYVQKREERVILKKDHAIFLAAIFCFWFATYIYSPVFGVYLQSKGFSYTEVGIIIGSYGITQILLRLPLGILSDYLSKLRKQLFVGGFAVSLLSCLILVYFDSFFMIMLARLMAGVTASMWVMATVLYTYYFGTGQSAKAMGTLQFITVATQFASMAISGFIVEQFGWNAPFWIGAVASVLGILLAWQIKDIQQPESMTNTSFNLLSYLRVLLTLPGLKMITFLSLAAHAILFITIFGFSPIIAAENGVSETAFIWLVSAFFIPHALASLSLVFIKIDSRYNKRILWSCFGITGIFLLLVPLTETLLTLSMVHFVIGLALGFVFPILLDEVVRCSPAHLKMSAMGFFQSFYALGIFLGPLAAGSIAEHIGLSEVFYFTGIFALVTVMAVLFLFQRNSRMLEK
ncbi:MFS transporter [Oceanobacillus oncorhynchi subsp. oncorhynchi]|uniref:MFS transporter n=1 Tax=Oceanobacillus oncorhynchi TaxID=545501 RepID=UPI0031E20A47